MASSVYKLMRYKFINYPAGTRRIQMNFYAHNSDYVKKICEKDIVVLPMKACGTNDYKYIKYLSTDGKYKFIPFRKFTTLSQTDEALGETSKLLTDLKTAQGDNYQLGYSSKKQMLLSTSCTEEQYDEWSKVFQSPRVYLQFKDPNLYDEDENWLLVKVEGSPNFVTKKSKNEFNLTITLPNYNNIIM